MLVGTVLNKHAANFANFFRTTNSSDFVGYAEIKDHVQDLGQPLRSDITQATSVSSIKFEDQVTQTILQHDHNGEFDYPITPVLATLTLLVGNINTSKF